MKPHFGTLLAFLVVCLLFFWFGSVEGRAFGRAAGFAIAAVICATRDMRGRHIP